jgi:tetratricopeptide (TPR) repeat protein
MTTTSLTDFFAFGTHKASSERLADRTARSKRNEHMLCRALNLRTVVAFVGSGCSAEFGYPTWESFATRIVKLTKKVAPADPRPESYMSVLAEYKRQKKPCPSYNLTLFIEGCKSILTRENQLEKYYDAVKQLFCLKAKRSEPTYNPYQNLFKLDIRRFVTTNYDVELERNLIRERNLKPTAADPLEKDPELNTFYELGGKKGVLRSFSQNTQDHEQLALFALAKMRGNENAVFHCHGRYDDGPSLIASESDYQSWYLSDENDSRRTFRQTIELLLESNPLLFVGYSLRDDDLLRPLRHLNALDPLRKHGRPIFALAPWERDTDDVYDEVLYERYGAHVISYDLPPRPSRLKRTIALCEKLRELKERWHQDRCEWTQKPKVRAARWQAHDSKAADILTPTEVSAGKVVREPFGTSVDLDKEVVQPGIIGLLGTAGSGKSLLLLRLLNECTHPFQQRFYWNAHYGAELLPALDEAIAFFAAGGGEEEPRHRIMARMLREKQLLLIVDGCERLLHKTWKGEVESYSSAFNLLLGQLVQEMKSAEDFRSTVIFSGRLLPAELQAAGSGGRQRILHVSKVVTADIRGRPSFGRHTNSLPSLCSLLRGHNYGLCLAEHYLNLKPVEATERLSKLLQELAARPPDQRLTRMVKMFVDELDGDPRRKGLVSTFLDRLARFASPVCMATCDLCYGAAVREVRPLSVRPGDLANLLKRLGNFGLVLKMRRHGTAAEGYCVQATARRELLRSRHGLATDSLPDFGISGFTSDRIDVDLDPERRLQIEELFAAIMDDAEDHVDRPAGHDLAADLCTDAFALLRGTMAANTAPRWCTYDAYCKLGIRLARLAKAVCVLPLAGPGLAEPVGTWSYCEYFDRKLIESEAAPLHVSELAWLYNDVALALSAEGLLADAYSVWEQVFEISRTMEHPHPGGGYRIEVLLNLAHVFIEMGRLREARAYLDSAAEFNATLKDGDYDGRILGFRGLLAHLGGNLPEADLLYKNCHPKLRSGNNLRARSVFLKHHADLKMSMSDLDSADLLIRESRALAEAGVFPDLVAFARVSHGHWLAQSKCYKESRQEYQSLLLEAQRMGARKLEAECQSTLSTLSLLEGDVEGARVRAMKALSLANELGLGLRLTNSMVVLGKATIEAGQRDLGIAYLRNARLLAYEQEYWHRAWLAETALQRLGVQP